MTAEPEAEAPASFSEAKLREIRELYPLLSWHFHISPLELLVLPGWLKEAYVDALPRLIAQEQLRMIEAAAFPYHEESAQQGIIRNYTKHLPGRGEAPAPRSIEELQFLAAASGIAVVIEPPAGGEGTEE